MLYSLSILHFLYLRWLKKTTFLMNKVRVLYVSQEIFPYLPESEMANVSRNLPQAIQEKEKEIRTFMPRFGCINERRHQLHEVIRLSGMNLIIDDHDHPLIIKVASIQQARMQVYFIDNEEYFKRKNTFKDSEGVEHPDNHERLIFFGKGVLETVKKLGWAPDIIHCHGWFSSILPLYVRKEYENDPIFANSKIIYSAYNYADGIKQISKKFASKAVTDRVEIDDLSQVSTATIQNLDLLAAQYADGVIIGSDSMSKGHIDNLKEVNSNLLEYQNEDSYVDAYDEFYDKVLEESGVLAD